MHFLVYDDGMMQYKKCHCSSLTFFFFVYRLIVLI